MAKKVLVIEDSPTDAAFIKEVLQDGGLEVSVAGTGGEGIEKALQIKPDIIVLDLILPDIDGIVVCRKLKEKTELKNTIIVILSIRDNVEDIREAFNAGADDYIIKPPASEFLVKKIKLYLGIRE